MTNLTFGASAALVAALALASQAARADEGMWTFDHFSAAKVQQAYGVKIDQKWLDRVQAASVRLTSGCSASWFPRTAWSSPTTIAWSTASRACRTTRPTM